MKIKSVSQNLNYSQINKIHFSNKDIKTNSNNIYNKKNAPRNSPFSLVRFLPFVVAVGCIAYATFLYKGNNILKKFIKH